MLFKVFSVGACTVVKAIHPCITHQLNQIFVALIVFGKHHQVVVAFGFFFFLAMSHIHLASQYGFKWWKSLLFTRFIHLSAIVGKFFDAIHHAMVGERHAWHTIGYRHIHQGGNL